MSKSVYFGRNAAASATRAEQMQRQGLRSLSSCVDFFARYGRQYVPIFLGMVGLAAIIAGLEGIKAGVGIVFIQGALAGADALGPQPAFLRPIAQMLVTDQGLRVMRALMFFLAAGVAVAAAQYGCALLVNRFQLDVLRNVRSRLYDKMFAFSVDFFNESRTGELLFMYTAEASRFSNIATHVKTILLEGVVAAVLAGLLFMLAPLVTVVLGGIVMAFFLMNLSLTRRIRAFSWQANATHACINEQFHQALYGIKLIHIGNLLDRTKDDFATQHRDFENESMRVAQIKAGLEGTREIFFLLLLCVVVVFFMRTGSALVTAGQVIAYLMVLKTLVPKIGAIQSALLSLLEVVGPLQRIMDLLEKPGDDEVNQSGGQVSKISTIETRDIHCRLENSRGASDVLRGVSLAFQEGRSYAIVGYSGSGKSTFLDVLIAIRRATRGTVLFNGVSLDELAITSLRSRMTYMNQDPIIFHDTLRENVRFFKKDATDDEIRRVLSIACLDDFLKGLPAGLDTGLGERGLMVSGGERQRIGLARVLLKDFDVLLLDEATNALDYRTEQQVYKNVATLNREAIVIAVAHRLSAVVDFDRILVMNKGIIEEVGTHEQLMTAKGLYYSLYTLQQTQGDVRDI